jgi:hypothetical protein
LSECGRRTGDQPRKAVHRLGRLGWQANPDREPGCIA